MIQTIIISAGENVNREGLHFGAGIAVLGGQVTETTIDTLNNINKKKFFTAIPTLDVSIGYGFTPQFKINLTTQTLLVGGLLNLESQYYINNEINTMYVHAGITKAYNTKNYDSFSNKIAGSIGVGYAHNHMEYDISIGNSGSAMWFTLSANYLF